MSKTSSFEIFRLASQRCGQAASRSWYQLARPANTHLGRYDAVVNNAILLTSHLECTTALVRFKSSLFDVQCQAETDYVQSA